MVQCPKGRAPNQILAEKGVLDLFGDLDGERRGCLAMVEIADKTGTLQPNFSLLCVYIYIRVEQVSSWEKLTIVAEKRYHCPKKSPR